MTALHPRFFSPQRVMWGAVLFVGSVLILYANAPVLPVIVGCLAVPVITALRTHLQSRNKSG